MTPPTFGHLPLAEAAGAENYTPPEKGETGQFTGEGVIFPKRGVIICTKH